MQCSSSEYLFLDSHFKFFALENSLLFFKEEFWSIFVGCIFLLKLLTMSFLFIVQSIPETSFESSPVQTYEWCLFPGRICHPMFNSTSFPTSLGLEFATFITWSSRILLTFLGLYCHLPLVQTFFPLSHNVARYIHSNQIIWSTQALEFL